MALERDSQTGSLIRILFIIIAVVLLAPLLMMAFMMPMMSMMGTGINNGMAMSPIWGLGTMLVYLLILLGIGYSIYRAFTRGSLSRSEPALEELRLTYARGKISKEEFEQRQEDLRQSK